MIIIIINKLTNRKYKSTDRHIKLPVSSFFSSDYKMNNQSHYRLTYGRKWPTIKE